MSKENDCLLDDEIGLGLSNCVGLKSGNDEAKPGKSKSQLYESIALDEDEEGNLFF